MSNYLFISDAAKEVKVESHVLRYWEEELHLPIKRNELGHRYYTEEDVERFKQIKGMKERGLQLKAIKMILKEGKLDVLPTEEERRDNRKIRGHGEEQMVEEPLTESRMSQARISRERGYGERVSGNGQDVGGDLAIDIIAQKDKEQVIQESREEKSRRLQWLLQQLIRQTLQENNGALCREIRESVVKELDYQFRMQEEREEARDRMLAERDEEHYKRMDELLRQKSYRVKKTKPEKEQEGREKPRKKVEKKSEKMNPEIVEQDGQAVAMEKKKRRFF